MNPPTPETSPWIDLERLLDEADTEKIASFLGGLAPIDVARTVSRLDDAHRSLLLSSVDANHAASVVEQIPPTQAAEAIERLEPDVAAAILHELPGDERADLLGGLGEPAAEAILDAMESDDAASTRALREYPDDRAGGLMTVEYLSYGDALSVADVLHDLRDSAERYRDFVVQYVFVVSRAGRLVGVLRLRDLLFADEHRLIRDLMLREPLSIRDTDSLDELRALFDRHPLYGVPVVDAGNRLVGIIHREAVQEALVERDSAAFLRTRGIVGGEELRTMPVLQRSRRRLSWLSVNILLNVFAAGVIAIYQETLAAVIALAVFLPIISDMSGCSGNQAVAVSMRELSLGILRPSEVRRVWLKEVSVGCINGLALGLLIAGVAWAWQGNPYLGLVVGVALMANTILAVSIGGTVPLMLKRLGVDPALASSPILTTVTDMCGFFLLLSIAEAFLPQLTAG